MTETVVSLVGLDRWGGSVMFVVDCAARMNHREELTECAADSSPDYLNILLTAVC